MCFKTGQTADYYSLESPALTGVHDLCLTTVRGGASESPAAAHRGAGGRQRPLYMYWQVFTADITIIGGAPHTNTWSVYYISHNHPSLLVVQNIQNYEINWWSRTEAWEQTDTYSCSVWI